ncbi:hypothetical protein C8245_13900 [Paracidovorax avenae]|nr:hypothetical protein C8245_13900 [Paracidovorax avenae]
MGGFGCFLTLGSLVGVLETPVRWAMGTCGALLLVCVFVAGRSARPRDQGKAPGRAASLQSVASRLARIAVQVLEQWHAAMADAQQKKVAAKTPPKPAPILPATFAFSYRDADGMFTERVVRIHTVEDAEGVAYLTGYCDLRKEERTFRSDRISGGFRLIYTPHTYSVYEVVRCNLI